MISALHGGVFLFVVFALDHVWWRTWFSKCGFRGLRYISSAVLCSEEEWLCCAERQSVQDCWYVNFKNWQTWTC